METTIQYYRACDGHSRHDSSLSCEGRSFQTSGKGRLSACTTTYVATQHVEAMEVADRSATLPQSAEWFTVQVARHRLFRCDWFSSRRGNVLGAICGSVALSISTTLIPLRIF